MKKFLQIAGLLAVCATQMLPLSRGAEDPAAGTELSGTPQDMANLQKSLRDERLDTIEHSISDLRDALNALSERMEDLERTVFDDNGRT